MACALHLPDHRFEALGIFEADERQLVPTYTIPTTTIAGCCIHVHRVQHAVYHATDGTLSSSWLLDVTVGQLVERHGLRDFPRILAVQAATRLVLISDVSDTILSHADVL